MLDSAMTGCDQEVEARRETLLSVITQPRPLAEVNGTYIASRYPRATDARLVEAPTSTPADLTIGALWRSGCRVAFYSLAKVRPLPQSKERQGTTPMPYYFSLLNGRGLLQSKFRTCIGQLCVWIRLAEIVMSILDASSRNSFSTIPPAGRFAEGGQHDR